MTPVRDNRAGDPDGDHHPERHLERHARETEHRQRQRDGARADGQHPDQLVAAVLGRQQPARQAEPADREQPDRGDRDGEQLGERAPADHPVAGGQVDRRGRGDQR